MLINLRNAMMAGKRLPYDAEVEYLESTGTQFIEVPLVVDRTATVNITGYVAATNKELFSFDKNGLKQFNIETGATYYRWWTMERIDLGSGYVNALHAYKCNSSLWVDGALAGTTTPTLSDRTKKFYVLCGGHNVASGRIYSVSVEYGGALVFDAIPVRKKTVGYLYDRVSKRLFGNAGTGDFVLGPDVVRVEYIESHRTEWIDTGIKLRSTDTIDTRLYINSSSTTSWHGILGARDAERYLCVRCFSNNDGIINAFDPFKNFTFSRYTWGNLSFTFGGDYHESATNCYLFTYNNNGPARSSLPYRFANFSITRDSLKIINLLPVRVGSGSTWEGAMMDVLTRRIYRNAGTGAFTWGNDLRYPIPSE